jgi:hypothetical protein
MRGLGRLLALPWLLIALAVQSLAPAEAAAMHTASPSPFGICSASDLGGASHRPDPARGKDHDCCAFACALVGVGAAPPVQALVTRSTIETPARVLVPLFDLTPGRGLAAPPPPSQGPPTPFRLI